MSRTPLLLDLFSGGGGAGAGYARAGFTILGVDHEPQPRYPGEFLRADWSEGLRLGLARGAVAVHASPPCQPYSPHVKSTDSPHVPTRGKAEPALIAEVRAAIPAGMPYVIENVVGARRHLVGPVLLCGAMFGRPIARHRLFEVRPRVEQPLHPPCRGLGRRSAEGYQESDGLLYLAGEAGLGWEERDMSVTGKGRHAGTRERWAWLLGVEHPMSQHELAEAIPPAYTEWIGRRLLAGLHAAEAI